MRIYEEVTIDMNPDSSTYGEHLSEEVYEYEGDIVLCSGGWGGSSGDDEPHWPGTGSYEPESFNQASYSMNPYSTRMEGAGMFGDLARQLIGLGIGKSTLARDVSNLQGISGGHVSGALRKAFGIGEKMPSAMFSPITEQQTRGLKWETYQPMLEQKQQSLSQGLAHSLGSKEARQAGGGFAGSAAQKSFETSARDVYGKGMTGAIGDVAGMRTQAYSNVQDVISNWLQQATTFKTGG